MAGFAEIILIGRLTKKPELRYTTGGTAVADLAVAVDRGNGDDKKTDFFDVTCWRQAAEFASEYLDKGRLVVIQGRPEFREWEGQDGRKNKKFQVQANVVRPLDFKPNGQADTDDLPRGRDVMGQPEDEAGYLF